MTCASKAKEKLGPFCWRCVFSLWKDLFQICRFILSTVLATCFNDRFRWEFGTFFELFNPSQRYEVVTLKSPQKIKRHVLLNPDLSLPKSCWSPHHLLPPEKKNINGLRVTFQSTNNSLAGFYLVCCTLPIGNALFKLNGFKWWHVQQSCHVGMRKSSQQWKNEV